MRIVGEWLEFDKGELVAERIKTDSISDYELCDEEGQPRFVKVFYQGKREGGVSHIDGLTHEEGQEWGDLLQAIITRNKNRLSHKSFNQHVIDNHTYESKHSSILNEELMPETQPYPSNRAIYKFSAPRFGFEEEPEYTEVVRYGPFAKFTFQHNGPEFFLNIEQIDRVVFDADKARVYSLNDLQKAPDGGLYSAVVCTDPEKFMAALGGVG